MFLSASSVLVFNFTFLQVMFHVLFLSVTCLLTVSILQTLSHGLTREAVQIVRLNTKPLPNHLLLMVRIYKLERINGSGSDVILLCHLSYCVLGRVLRSQHESLVSLNTQHQCPGLMNDFRTAASWGPRSSDCHRPSDRYSYLAHILGPVALSLASLARGLEIWRRKRKLLQVCSLSFHTCSPFTFVSHL